MGKSKLRRKRSRGRKTVLTRQLQEKICQLIRAGTYDYVAAEASGISRATFFDWMGEMWARSVVVLIRIAQIDLNLETAGLTHLVGLDGIPIELCFMSQHAHPRIDVARVSVADSRLQLQVHVFEACGIFLTIYFRIDRGLPVHSLAITLVDCTFTDAVIGREGDSIRKRRQ